MNLMEKKMDAVMRFIAAENVADQRKAQSDVRALLDYPAFPADECPEWAVRRILLELGVPETVQGHGRLVTAICAVIQNPDLLNAIAGELYPLVAVKHQTTWSRVERSIRHAIEAGWDRFDFEVQARYFGNTVSPAKGKPTNKEFIARVANIVRNGA